MRSTSGRMGHTGRSQRQRQHKWKRLGSEDNPPSILYNNNLVNCRLRGIYLCASTVHWGLGRAPIETGPVHGHVVQVRVHFHVELEEMNLRVTSIPRLFTSVTNRPAGNTVRSNLGLRRQVLLRTVIIGSVILPRPLCSIHAACLCEHATARVS